MSFQKEQKSTQMNTSESGSKPKACSPVKEYDEMVKVEKVKVSPSGSGVASEVGSGTVSPTYTSEMGNISSSDSSGVSQTSEMENVCPSGSSVTKNYPPSSSGVTRTSEMENVTPSGTNVTNVYPPVSSGVTRTSDTTVNPPGGVIDTITQAGSGVVNTITQAGSGVANTIAQAGSGVANTIAQAGSGAAHTIAQAGTTIAQTGTTIAQAVRGTQVGPSGEMTMGGLLSSIRKDHSQFRSNIDSLLNITDVKTKLGLFNDTIKLCSQYDVAEEVVLYSMIRNMGLNRVADTALEQTKHFEKLLYDMDQKYGGGITDIKAFDEDLTRLRDAFNLHVNLEENEIFPSLESYLSLDDIDSINKWFDRTKTVAPTRPHPAGPHSTAGKLLTGPVLSFVDRFRDLGKQFTKTP